jgi:hypothetical protein
MIGFIPRDFSNGSFAPRTLASAQRRVRTDQSDVQLTKQLSLEANKNTALNVDQLKPTEDDGFLGGAVKELYSTVKELKGIDEKLKELASQGLSEGEQAAALNREKEALGAQFNKIVSSPRFKGLSQETTQIADIVQGSVDRGQELAPQQLSSLLNKNALLGSDYLGLVQQRNAGALRGVADAFEELARVRFVENGGGPVLVDVTDPNNVEKHTNIDLDQVIQGLEKAVDNLFSPDKAKAVRDSADERITLSLKSATASSIKIAQNIVSNPAEALLAQLRGPSLLGVG